MVESRLHPRHARRLRRRRSGRQPGRAGAVSEIAAAGKPSILVPFPFAADSHQTGQRGRRWNAAARALFVDAELNGD